MAQEEKGRGTADMPRDTIHGAGSKQKESKEGDSHAVHAVHEPREPRAAEASKEGGAGVSGAAGEVHARPVQVLPASQPRQASQHGGAEQGGREASASVSGTSGPDAGSTSPRSRGDPGGSSVASGVASAAEEDKVTRPAKDEAAEAAAKSQEGRGEDSAQEGLGASGEAALGGLGLAPDSEYSKTQIHTERSDYPTSSGDGQHAVSDTGKDEQMQVDEDEPASAANKNEGDAKGKGKEVSKPAMFAYANAPRLPPTQAPAAPRGLASLPARPSAAVSFGRSRAPLPSQNDSYATSLGAPLRDKKDGPRPVDRSALTSLIFSATPRPASELLQLPLPSRRQTRRATGAGVLIPVERLPLLPLPPLPPILDAKVEKVVFSHQSLFPRDAGVFEYPVQIKDGDWHGGVPHYEKLEHVGDAILGGVVTTWLHRCWPGLTCGTATKLKAHLVSNNTLSHLSGMYHLPARLACAPLLRVQTDIRAALVEAYIAGVYFSHPPGRGIQVVTDWLEEMYAPLADFFLQHMRSEYAVLRATLGTSDGRVVTHSSSAARLLPDPSSPARVEESSGEDKSAGEAGEPSALRISHEGRRGSVSQPDALEAADERMRPALAALSRHCQDTRTTLEFREKRFRLSSGTLWRITLVVGGQERGEGTRVTKYRARWVAAAQACDELGVAWTPEESGGK